MEITLIFYVSSLKNAININFIILIGETINFVDKIEQNCEQIPKCKTSFIN